MKRIALFLASIACSPAFAFHLVSDPITGNPTHCRVFIDALPPVLSPVDANKACFYDLAALGLAAGSHTAKATSVLVDPIQGDKESAPSATLNFTVNAAPGTPSNVRLGL